MFFANSKVKIFKKLMVILVISALAGNFLFLKSAQAWAVAPWGYINGVVKDAGSNEAIESALLEIFLPGEPYDVWDIQYSNSQGEYEFGDYFCEGWEIKVSKDGYVTQTQAISLPCYSSAVLNFYLEPEAPPIDPLILQYEPILQFHEDEDFYPMNVETFVEYSSLWDSRGNNPDEELIAEGEVILTDLEAFANTENYYLQFSQNLTEKEPDPVLAKMEYQWLANTNRSHNTYYVYKTEDSFIDDYGYLHEYLVLEYWYFYPFNDWKEKGGLNNHEGDWECVMVFLDKDSEEPMYIAYSAHHNKGDIALINLSFGSVRRAWNDNNVKKIEDNVVSFVALGSHANYPNNGILGIHYVPPTFLDKTSLSGEIYLSNDWTEKSCFTNNNLPQWLTKYEGLWGIYTGRDGFNGSDGPYFSEYDKFLHPIQWAGIDKVFKKTITDTITDTLDLTSQKAKLVFDETLDIGTEILVDLHDEVITFGENLNEIIILPHFWVLETSMDTGNFGVNVSLDYNLEELEILGLSEEHLTVLLYNETTGLWQEVPSVLDMNNSLVSFFTNHFSKYALGANKWQSIDEQVKVVKEEKHYNKDKGIKTIEVKMKNETKKYIDKDLRLMIKDISEPGVEWLNYTATISNGEYYLDIGKPFRECAYNGTEEDLPAGIKDSDKKKLVKDKPLNEQDCEKMLKKYPLLAEMMEWVWGSNKYTKSVELHFSVPSSKVKKFEFRVEVLGKID